MPCVREVAQYFKKVRSCVSRLGTKTTGALPTDDVLLSPAADSDSEAAHNDMGSTGRSTPQSSHEALAASFEVSSSDSDFGGLGKPGARAGAGVGATAVVTMADRRATTSPDNSDVDQAQVGADARTGTVSPASQASGAASAAVVAPNAVEAVRPQVQRPQQQTPTQAQGEPSLLSPHGSSMHILTSPLLQGGDVSDESDVEPSSSDSEVDGNDSDHGRDGDRAVVGVEESAGSGGRLSGVHSVGASISPVEPGLAASANARPRSVSGSSASSVPANATPPTTGDFASAPAETCLW